MTADRAALAHPLLRDRVLWLAWLGWLVVQVWGFAGVRQDDAYITYRYGQNLATGAGLVFNPGEHVFGSTSPGQVLLSAAVYALAGLEHTPQILAAIGCMGWSVQSLALFLLLSPALGRLGALLIAASVALGSTHAQSFVPLETNLVAASVLFAFVCAERRHWYGAALCAALATLLRPDAFLPALLLGGFCIWELRKQALGPCLAFALPAAAWPLFARAYYGTPLPNSALAKLQRSRFGDYLLHELQLPGALLMPELPALLAAVLTLGLALAGAVLLLRRAPRLLPFVSYSTVHALAYLWLRPPLQHTWHLYPWVLVLCALCWSALICLSRWPRAHAAALVAGLALFASHIHGFVHSVRTLEGSYWTGQRQAVYEDVAAYLREHASAGDWFASVEVGTIAYYTDLPAFDFGGLVTQRGSQLTQYPVRFLVVDKLYMRRDTRAAPVYQSRHGDFLAVVYRTGP